MNGGRVLKEIQCVVTSQIYEKENILRCDDGARYKELYHSCVQRCNGLADGMEAQRSLINKVAAFDNLKTRLLNAVKEQASNIDRREEELRRERLLWKQKLDKAKDTEDKLSQECQRLRLQCQQYEDNRLSLIDKCAYLLTQQSLGKALQVLSEEKRQTEKQCTEREVSKLKRTIAQLTLTLKRERSEYKESVEFSEAECAMLAEANREIENELSDLRPLLADKNIEIQKLSGQLQQTEGDLSLATVTIEQREKAIEELKVQLETPCQLCSQTRVELETMAGVLDRERPGKYGELVMDNLALQRKLSECQRTIEKKNGEFESLLTYTQEYKDKSTAKVGILKENLHKADDEIRELDGLVDTVRECLRSNQSVVKTCPDLLSLLKELDGDEL